MPSHYGPTGIGGMDNMYDSHRYQSPPGMGHQSYPPYSTNSSMPVSSSQDSQLKRDKDSIYGYVNSPRATVYIARYLADRNLYYLWILCSCIFLMEYFNNSIIRKQVSKQFLKISGLSRTKIY